MRSALEIRDTSRVKIIGETSAESSFRFRQCEQWRPRNQSSLSSGDVGRITQEPTVVKVSQHPATATNASSTGKESRIIG